MVRVQKKAAGNKAVKRSAEGVENSPEKKAKNEKVDATSLKPGELKVKAALDAICTLAKDDLPVVDSDRIGLVETLESKLGFSIPEDLRYYWLLTKTEFFDGVQEVKQALKAFTDEEEECSALFRTFKMVPLRETESSLMFDVLDLASGHVVLVDVECDDVYPKFPSFQAYLAATLEKAKEVRNAHPEITKGDFYKELTSVMSDVDDSSFSPDADRFKRFASEWVDALN